jgi:ADP-ribose pyrophosphatase YjhB (NUDIX family)
MIDHHIQREILTRLMSATSLRFSELKPDGMESNIFMYHIKQLQKSGFIEKSNIRYQLSALGLGYVDTLSTKNHKPRRQPKIVAMFVIFNKTHEVLLSRRLHQPFLGSYTFPCGKQHFGETINEHVLREKQEKLGFDVTLTYKGQLESLIEQLNEPILHTVNYIFSGVSDCTVPISPDERFELSWQPIDTVDSLSLVPGVQEILRHSMAAAPLFIDSVRTRL